MTEDPEDWHVRRKRYDAFKTTELGKLFLTYENALVAYWQTGDDEVSTEELMKADRTAKDATHAFVTKLMEFAGV
jgi:hypothetical protein